LLAMSVLVVLDALVDVRVAPLQHAIDEAGEFVSHGRHRFGRAEFAPEATILGAEVTLTPKEGGRADPERGGGPIDHGRVPRRNTLPPVMR